MTAIVVECQFDQVQDILLGITGPAPCHVSSWTASALVEASGRSIGSWNGGNEQTWDIYMSQPNH